MSPEIDRGRIEPALGFVQNGTGAMARLAGEDASKDPPTENGECAMLIAATLVIAISGTVMSDSAETTAPIEIACIAALRTLAEGRSLATAGGG
jgi:hypothetical protein